MKSGESERPVNQVITALTRGRIDARYTMESTVPTIPVTSQKNTISAIHIAFDDPAPVNAPPGREIASTSAQIGMTSATSQITRMITRSTPCLLYTYEAA